MATFYGLGVGPGDRELVTIKAVNVLKNIDVLIIPTTKNGKSVAYDITKDYVNPDAKLHPMDFPMVRDHEAYAQNGWEAAKVVMAYLHEGKDVAFITIGDPTLYSTYGYILKGLSEDVEVVTVPGVPSFCACAAASNTMLCEREETLTILPTIRDEASIAKVGEMADNLVFMKVAKHGHKLEGVLKSRDHVFVAQCGHEDEVIAINDMDAIVQNDKYLATVIAKRGDRNAR